MQTPRTAETEDSNAGSVRGPQGGLTPAGRAALDALEREFSELLMPKPRATVDAIDAVTAAAEQRADVARRILYRALR